MPYPYTIGDKVLATEYNEVVKAAGLYAADAGASDTYAITVSPVPSSYIAGMVFRFKANTVNTGAATLNVNSLGAKSILRPDGSALADGDIAAGQVVEVVYNGTNLLMVSPIANSPKITYGVTSRDLSTASGNQTIAHGLGRTPRIVRMTVMQGNTTINPMITNISEGIYNGTTTSNIYRGGNGNVQGFTGTDSTYMVNIFSSDISSTSPQTATITVDATNITLAWIKNASPTATAYIQWEALA